MYVLLKTQPDSTPLHKHARSSISVRVGPWSIVGVRTVLFAVFQAIIAGIFVLQGQMKPWDVSTAWWPLTASLTNLVTIGLLAWLMLQEGRSLWTLYGGQGRGKIQFQSRTLLLALGVIAVGLPLAILPNIGLGALLFGEPSLAAAIMFRPIPVWAAAISLVLFPVTIAFAELPSYFSFAMPRLTDRTGSPWIALPLTASALSVQHATLPLVFNSRFLLWRTFMFLPFALYIGFVLQRRPHLLPYMMVAHGLLDFSVVWMVWTISVDG